MGEMWDKNGCAVKVQAIYKFTKGVGERPTKEANQSQVEPRIVHVSRVQTQNPLAKFKTVMSFTSF